MSGIHSIEGDHKARDLRFAVVAARFNDVIVGKLVDGAVDMLRKQGASTAHIEVIRVPGAFELPVAISALLARRRHDAVIALGAVVRGDTPHFDYVAGECASGLARLALDSGVPISFGVLTTDTMEQALERAMPVAATPTRTPDGKDTTKGSNKGAEAALCAIEMATLLRRLKS